VADAAREAGATIVTGCRVEDVADDRDGLVVRAGARRIRAEVVVYAAGHALAALDPTFDDKVFPVREEALLADYDGPPMPVRAGWGYTFFRATKEGVLAGGCRWAAPSMGVGARTTDTDPKVQGRIEAAVRKHLPAAGAVTRRWAWLDTYTCDGLPIVGPLPGSARRIACTGFCGNDAGLAPASAASVADGLLGSGQPDVPRCLAASRFV
jgi:glycine/D-amino acid oxidase-like deaminating enzyme